MIFGHPPAPKMKYADLPAEHWQRIVSEAITHGTAMAFNDPDLDAAALKARQDFRKRTHTDLDIVKVDLSDGIDGIHVRQAPKPTVNVFDAVKMAARQARIDRNAMRVYPVIKKDVMARTRREHDLANAIERTQLPHEMTIHERIMPYRVKE